MFWVFGWVYGWFWLLGGCVYDWFVLVLLVVLAVVWWVGFDLGGVIGCFLIEVDWWIGGCFGCLV